MYWFYVGVLTLSAVVLCDGAFCGEPMSVFPDIGPETTLNKYYLSVTSLGWEPFHGVDLLEVYAPVNATVTQIMLVAEMYSGGEFWFESHYDPIYGTYISAINGIYNDHPWYWFLYDIMEDSTLTECGTDFTHARPYDHFHWIYDQWIPQY